MSPSSEFEVLTGALLDALYVLLSIARIRKFAPTEVKYRGERIAVPSNIVLMLKIVARLSEFLTEFRKIVLSPARALEEEVVVDREVRGPLYLPVTVQLRGRGLQLVAYKRRRLTLSSPENILLKLFLRRLIGDIELVLRGLEELASEGSESRIAVLRGFLGRLEGQLRYLAQELRSVERLPLVRGISIKGLEPDDRTLLKYSRIVLRRRTRGYARLALLVQRYLEERLDIGLVRRDLKQYRHLAVAVEPYKLYEVFAYYVTAVALVEALRASPSITVSSAAIRAEIPGGAEYVLLYDEPVPQKSWLRSGRTRFDGVESGRVPPGRPDVTLLSGDRPLLVLDAKYTKSYAYLSQSRYKILGYFNEYGVGMGAIAFDPSLLSEEPVEKEDEEFSSLLKEASRRGGAIIEDADRRIYLLPLKPIAWSELACTRAYALMTDMVGCLLERSEDWGR